MPDQGWVFVGEALQLIVSSSLPHFDDLQKARNALLLELIAGSVPAKATSFLVREYVGAELWRHGQKANCTVPSHYWMTALATDQSGAFDDADRELHWSWDWDQSKFIKRWKAPAKELGCHVTRVEEALAVSILIDALKSSLSLLAGTRSLPQVQQTPRKRGRTKGSGKIDDREVVNEMHKLISNGEANSAHRAAQMLVDKIPGSGIEESRIKRARDRYKQRYGA